MMHAELQQQNIKILSSMDCSTSETKLSIFFTSLICVTQHRNLNDELKKQNIETLSFDD